MRFEIGRITAIYEGWTRFLLVSVQTPEGKTIRREVAEHHNAAAVLPYDPDRKTAILVRQFRAPVRMSGDGEDILEAIAGIVEDGSPDEAAKREAWEEAGLELGHLEPAGTHWTAPGLSTERIALYLSEIRAAYRTGKGGGVANEDEHIEIVEIALDDLARAADNGGLRDLKTFALVQTLRLRRPDLF